MVKYILVMLMLLSAPMHAFNTLTNINIKTEVTDVTTEGSYVRVKVKCDNGACSVDSNDINKARLVAIANIKSIKSWVRDFSTGNAVRYLKTIRVSDAECVIIFIICHSSDSKMYDNTFGIEILYKDK